jgi:hypothetical protein
MNEFKNYLEMNLKDILQEKAKCLQELVNTNDKINEIRGKINSSKTNYHKGKGDVLDSNEYAYLMGAISILETEKESLKFNLVVIEDAANYAKGDTDKHRKVLDLIIKDKKISRVELESYYKLSKIK